MEKKKSLSSRLLLSLVLQISGVFLVAAGLAVYLVNSNFSGLEQVATVSNSMLLIFGISLLVAIVMIALALKGASSRIAQLAEITDRLAAGDTEVVINHRSRDQLDNLAAGIASLAENITYQALVAGKLAAGDLEVDIQPVSKNDLLGKSLADIRDSVKMIETATAQAAQAAQNGILMKNEAAKGIPGHYRQVIENVYLGLTVFSDQSDLYLAILDALPFRVTAMNMDREFVFINKFLGDLLKSAGLHEKREDAYGLQCSSRNLEMCGTENCGIRRLLEKGLTEFPFQFKDWYFNMDTVHLMAKNGESIGFVEFTLDTTAIMSVNNYTHKEIERLSGNLLNLADGNLDFNLNIQEAGEYTAEISVKFVEIEKNLEQVKQSIGSLIDNAIMLSNSAIDGNLDARADETKFRGSWQHLIVGMNQILEEIAKPTREIAQVMNAMAVGSLQVNVEGNYMGEFDNLKQSVNVLILNQKKVISKITEVTGQIADKNLDIESVETWRNDYAPVSDALNRIIEILNDLMGDIDDAARQVTAGSHQVSDASQALAQGSTEQASSVQELSAVVAEISDQTKNNAVNANQARELATDVQDHATRGNAQMAEMQNSMSEINKSSNDISKIIKVIDDIAFQTNILALNAAVEAARAGQHGKGFAVVAEEVRTLAARSAEAAKETTGLIEGSIDKVKAGTKIADETAAGLNEIVEGVVKVTELVGRIAVDSNEQASGIAQVNIGIEQVAQVVQNNSATAEESAAASEELSGQAVLLKGMIEQFNLRK